MTTDRRRPVGGKRRTGATSAVSGAEALDALPPPTDLSFSGAGNLYGTHALHAFAARCPPPLVDWAIRNFSSAGETVLDPMVGSGTALVEAALLGRAARGADIDPLARLIAKVKATPVDLAVLDKTAAEVARLLHDAQLDDSWRPVLPDGDRWFRRDVAADLARIREAIFQAGTDADVADLLWVCFSSLIVARTSVANARDLVHSRHHYRAWEQDPDLARVSNDEGASGKLAHTTTLGHLRHFRGDLRQSATPPDSEDPLKRWSAPLVHRAQAADQRFRDRAQTGDRGFSGLFLGT